MAKELSVKYKCEDTIVKKFCLSLPAGEMITLDYDFRNKYEKELKIYVELTYKYNSEKIKETLSLDLAKIKSGEIELSFVSPASPLRGIFEAIERKLRDIANNIERINR